MEQSPSAIHAIGAVSDAPKTIYSASRNP